MGNELRHNPFGDPVIVAAVRGRRPQRSRRHGPAGADTAEVGFDAGCPFCPGNESETPPEVDAFRPADGDASSPDTPGWRVRCVPNKFPALGPAIAIEPTGDNLFTAAPARGVHEVIVHSPRHDSGLHTLSVAEASDLIRMWQRRLDSHRAAGWASTSLVVNEGREAGASQAHPHSQVFALDFVPTRIATELERRAEWARRHGRSLLGTVVDAEGELLAWAPYWSHFRHEVWIAGATDAGDFAEAENTAGLARLLPRVCERIRRCAGDPAWNLVLHDPPAGPASKQFSWYLRLLPRTSIEAGFELATAIGINALPPEQAAMELRSVF